jgi:phosphomannomutase
MLSVSGARGIVGRSMTPVVAAEFAAAWGEHLRRTAGGAPVVCIGRDSRPSGQMLSAAAAAGLAAAGCAVIDLGVVPTPTVSAAVLERRAAGGMVVTASHNPAPWNGLKCIDGRGAAADGAAIGRVIERFRARAFEMVAADGVRPMERDDSAVETHVRRVLAAIGADADTIRTRGLTVVLDSVNGAGGPAGRLLLERLGCRVVPLHAEPTGCFAHPPEPLRENLEELARRTLAARADLGFAQDPDADRLAIVDERGRYIGEEYTLALCAMRVLQTRGPGVVVANLSTSRLVDAVVAAVPGSRVVRTPVGEAHVAAAMAEAGAIVGGEGNGGVIFPPVCGVRDSLSAMALVAGLVAERRRTLSRVITELPCPVMVKRRLDLAGLGAPPHVLLDRVAAAFAHAAPDTRDGVRIDLDQGWVHLRASNTEPIVRVIAEAATTAEAEALADRAASAAGLAEPG